MKAFLREMIQFAQKDIFKNHAYDTQEGNLYKTAESTRITYTQEKAHSFLSWIVHSYSVNLYIRYDFVKMYQQACFRNKQTKNWCESLHQETKPSGRKRRVLMTLLSSERKTYHKACGSGTTNKDRSIEGNRECENESKYGNRCHKW